jgi:hypothetical protein
MAILFLGGFGLAALGLSEDRRVMRYTLLVTSMVLALCGTTLLLRLARVTTLCMSQDPHSVSILAAARSHIEAMSGADSNQVDRYLTFLSYVQGASMGVQFCGILITYEFVVSLAMKVLVYAPVALGVAGEVLHRH